MTVNWYHLTKMGKAKVIQIGILTLIVSIASCNTKTKKNKTSTVAKALEEEKTIESIGVGAQPIEGAEMYFDGSREMLDEKWTYWNGPRLEAKLPIKWQVVENPNGNGKVVNSNDPASAGGTYGAADIVTKRKFKDVRVHVEFLVNNPKGNSGVYLQNRYEIQILDQDSTNHGIGAIVFEKAAPYKSYNGLGEWNSYDINFKAARFKDGELTEKSKMTVYFNNHKVHENYSVNKVWGGKFSGLDGGNNDGLGITDTSGGLKLQSEGHNVLYRNIWIKEIGLEDKGTDF